MAATLTQSIRVLDLHAGPEGFVRYTREPDDHTDIPTVVDLPYDDWLDLGSPDQLTVTLQPGDLLNP